MSQPSNVPIQVGSVITFKTTQYTVTKLFGRGGQGLACLVEDPIGNKRVYKKLVISLGHAKDVRNVRTEFAILIKEDFRHPCLARAEDVSMSSDFITNKLIGEIIMDYYAGGDLSSIERPMPEELIKKWLYQITLAVQHLHHHGILHRDIKPKNVFLTSQERDNADAVLGDFGIARYNEAGAQTMWGTPFYMAPEIVESHFLKHNYDEKVDIWSLGVLGYQMALEEDMESKYRNLCPDGVFSFSLKSNPDKAKTFYDDIRQLSVQKKYSEGYVDLLLKMMAMESTGRPSADEILTSDYFKDYKASLPSNNMVNNNNLNNSVSDSESGSHSLPKPSSNGHMNVPPVQPALAKSPRRDTNPNQANDSNNNNANDQIREGTIKMVLSYHPVKLATGLAQRMERNTLFVKIYKVINDDKTDKILETEKKIVDPATMSLKWNEIPIIDSSLKSDDVLEFDLYKIKRSIVYPLGREYHLTKICTTIDNLKQGMSLPVVKNDKTKGAIIIDKLEKNVKRGSALLHRDGSVGLAGVSNPKMALPKVVGEQSGAVVSPRSNGAQPNQQPSQPSPVPLEAKFEGMALRDSNGRSGSGSKPPKPLPQVPKSSLRASGQGQQLSPGLSPAGSEHNTPNPSPPPIPRSDSIGRTRSNSIPAAPTQDHAVPKRGPAGLGPAPVKASTESRAQKRKSDAPPPIREVPASGQEKKPTPPRPMPKQISPSPPKGVSKSSDFDGQMRSSLNNKEQFKNQLHNALSLGPKQPPSQSSAGNVPNNSGPSSGGPSSQPRDFTPVSQQTPLMAPTSHSGYDTPTPPMTPVNQGYNTPVSGQSSPYVPHASSAPVQHFSPSEIPSNSQPTALRTPTNPSHIPTTPMLDQGVNHTGPIPVQPQVYRSNSVPQSQDFVNVNNEEIMFVTPQLSQVHPNSPYIQPNHTYASPSSPQVYNNAPQQPQQMNNKSQYAVGPMSPVGHVDNSANQSQAYYNNGGQQQSQMNHNNNYAQQIQPQQQRQSVYNNNYGYNEYQPPQPQQQGWNVVTSPVSSNSSAEQQPNSGNNGNNGAFNNNNNYFPQAQPIVQQQQQQNLPQNYTSYQQVTNVPQGAQMHQYYVQQPQQQIMVGFPQAGVLPPGAVQVQIQPGANWPNAYGSNGMYFK